MCPLRIILIFLSATLAGFFVLRNIKSQSDTSLDTDAATAAADDSTSFSKSSSSASIGRSSSKIYGAFFLLPNNRINLLFLLKLCVDVGFLFYVQFGTGLDMNLCFDHSEPGSISIVPTYFELIQHLPVVAQRYPVLPSLLEVEGSSPVVDIGGFKV
ncbi:unnamed protein product [Lactuca saligna]|uniref:Uncharacterized protein n=1 Tax=Lactuca saligna TaxID=75948 RepID=A0AA35Z915_LACSI|nr:unnamed protein product [Lactuca saligna]